ncbi:MAG: MBL fold metallo-hydrolase [Spirochaetota bacterium]
MRGEHGLAYFIQTPEATILFDTGQSGAFLENAHTLSVNLAGLDVVILSLVIDTADGLVVMTGCAHRGILNIAEAARKNFPSRPIAALVGGFHLADLPDETLDRVADGIAALDPKRIFCGHCTGTRGFAAISARNRGNTQWLACGMKVEI